MCLALTEPKPMRAGRRRIACSTEPMLQNLRPAGKAFRGGKELWELREPCCSKTNSYMYSSVALTPMSGSGLPDPNLDLTPNPTKMGRDQGAIMIRITIAGN